MMNRDVNWVVDRAVGEVRYWDVHWGVYEAVSWAVGEAVGGVVDEAVYRAVDQVGYRFVYREAQPHPGLGIYLAGVG